MIGQHEADLCNGADIGGGQRDDGFRNAGHGPCRPHHAGLSGI